MAKVTYSKLNLKTKTDIATFEENGQTIEVKQYLPIEEKTKLISKVINNSITEDGYYNIALIELNMALEIVYVYTNVQFTEKQKSEPTKLYDSLISSEFYGSVTYVIPSTEINWIRNTVYATIEKIYEYKNSVSGILSQISKDYSNLDLNASEIQEKLADPENLELLKTVLTKLG